MKTLKSTLILMILGTLTVALADVSVDAQIAAIANAAPEERVSLVNKFKERLATMNGDERASAIAQMRSNTSSNTQAMRNQAQTKQRSRRGQMGQNEEMQKMQHMNQQQTGSQAMKQGTIGSSQSSGIPTKFMGHK